MRTPVQRLRRRAAWLIVAVLLLAGLGGYLWYQTGAASARGSAARSSMADATTAAQAIFSYDYRNFDASVAAGKRYTTGDFTAEYTKMTTNLKSVAATEQAVVQAQVSSIGVVSSSPKTVTVLVYLNQYRRNAKISGEKMDQNRVVLTMRKAGGSWKVSAASAI